MSDRRWQCGRFSLPLGRPLLMGVVNVTPDSFSDGGRYAEPAAAIAHARSLAADGADILDVGGESTRPGAGEVAADDELRRVLPVIEALSAGGCPVSVDTVKPVVMRAAIAAGAAIVNDVSGVRDGEALAAVADSDAGVCVMHMQGSPRTMQRDPRYRDVVAEVHDYLAARVQALAAAGVARARIAVDPGIGFGKTLEHNLALLRALPALRELGCAVLVGLSRKSMLGAITGRATDERMAASLAGALWCAWQGADIIRVHDVRETRDALRVWQALQDDAGVSAPRGERRRP